MNRETMVRSARRGFTALLALAALTACDDSITETPEPGQARTLSVYLTDAPGDVDSVWVEVEDVVLHGQGGGVSLLEAPTELLNITALRDSAALLVADVEVDSLEYRQIRFIIGDAVLETSAGEVYVLGDAEHPGGVAATGTLVCPSCDQSGIKVKLDGALRMEEGENGLLLDFDVSQSFGHQAGQSGKWIMHPVIHAGRADPDEIEDDEAGGEIHGTVALGEDDQGEPLVIPECGGEARTLEAFVPTATALTLTDDEGEPLTFGGETESEDQGHVFEIDVTDFDDYELGYQAETTFDGEQLVWTATADPTQVTVTETEDEVEGVAYVVTAVSCEAVTP